MTGRKETCQHLGRSFQGAGRAECGAPRLGAQWAAGEGLRCKER